MNWLTPVPWVQLGDLLWLNLCESRQRVLQRYIVITACVQVLIEPVGVLHKFNLPETAVIW